MIDPHDLIQFSFQQVFGSIKAEAHWRAAISAAYYALFHALTRAGASLVSASPDLRHRIARSYDHGALLRAAENVERAGLRPRSLDTRLVEVARAFNRLQEARRRADYQLEIAVQWEEAEELYWVAVSALQQFDAIRDLPETVEFLLSPLLRDRNRRG